MRRAEEVVRILFVRVLLLSAPDCLNTIVFSKYSKLGGGEIFNQSTLISIIIALPETYILLQLNYYCIEKVNIIQVFFCSLFFLPILVTYSAFLPAYFEDL